MRYSDLLEQGFVAHRLGLGIHTCKYTNKVERQAWRTGWMAREDAQCKWRGVVPNNGRVN